MPVAAIPNYLGTDFSGASPGMRFGMYLKLWEGAAWSKSKDKPLDSAKRLNDNDQKTVKALLTRQKQSFEMLDASTRFQLEARATAPFTTGLGNEHPLENGFAFLNPYGLPYLPGSGVKGVLRQSARELASGEWGDTRGWDENERFTLVLDKDKQIELDLLDVLFGKESKDGDTEHLRGVLSFWDVIPQINGDSLMVEIMTPHQSHYYQWKKDQRGNVIEVSPHDSGQPTPISFLTVPPGSGFTFHVTCDLARLSRIAPNLAKDGRWQTLLEAAFHHAFQWLGFGAKTAVGYGAMQRDTEAEARAAREKAEREAEAQRQREEAEHQAQRQAELAALSPIEREIQEFLDQRADKNLREITAVIGAVKQGRWQGEDKIAVAEWLKARMRADKGQWRETSQAKRPEKDKEYQNTLLVMKWLEME